MKPHTPTMRNLRITAATVLLAAGALVLQVAQAPQPGVTRTDLIRSDLSVPGREVIQVLVEFAPGGVAARHSHPDEEIVYVVEGALEYPGRWQAASDAQGRRRAVHSGRRNTRAKERRRWQGCGARDVHRRQREAAPNAGEVSNPCSVAYGPQIRSAGPISKE